jgi:hypothetical protein
VWWVLGGAGFALAVWGWRSAQRVLYPERRAVPAPDPLPDYTIHPLRASDGGPFDVWRLAPASPRGRVLVFHGYFANRHQVLGVAEGLRQRGYEALLIELRGHGRRPGPYTFGVCEARDGAEALNWAARAFSPLPAAVLGFSTGAAVACQVAGTVPGIRAVVTDSAYPRFYPIVRTAVRRRYHLPAVPFAWVTWWCLQAALRRRLSRVDPAALGARLRLPLLAIHGGEDRVVPVEDGRAFAARWAGQAEWWSEPGVGHVGMFARDPAAYAGRVAAFLDRHARE